MKCNIKECDKVAKYGAEFGGKTFNYCNKHLLQFILKDKVEILDLNKESFKQKLSLEEKNALIIKILGAKK